MNLYEIEQEIMNCVDMETGEIIDTEKLEQLQMDRDKKIENIALWIKNLKADAEALKAEKNALAERQKAAENKAESLKKYLLGFLAGEKFSTPKVAISFRKSESVQVTDIKSVMDFDDQYVKFAEPTVDKTAIKKAIKSGIAIPGAELVENQNIQIK